ncbi:MAG: hypothetical protein K2Z81_10630 [Cyanobacteria bacterium]|nr:hypothetical protein [Cyanobacteriota bacterium]
MTDSSTEVSEEMREHALACVEMIQDFGHELDFSEGTIGAVDALLNAFWKESDEDERTNLAVLFGGYVGELICARFPNASWKEPDETRPFPYISLGEIQVFPVVWCYKQVCNGPQDSLIEKYMKFRDQAIANGEDS